MDRLNVVGEADRRGLRPGGPGGYSGGGCYRALVGTQLAGGDFLSDQGLLADAATAVLRGVRHCRRWRRSRGLATAPSWTGPTVTIDPDATRVATYGSGKQDSTFDGLGQTGLSPLVGSRMATC